MLENVLSNISLFSALPEASIVELVNHTYTHIYEKDTIITHEGDVSDVLYVILSGSVKVFLENRQGECITLRVLHRGDYFGELSLLDESSRSASVITLDKTMLAIIDKAEFIKCLRNTPEIAINLCIELSRRMRAITENVKDLKFSEDEFRNIAVGL
jgi:CRP/FNR family cyclic AMP-dependent transcriptional regulator